MDILNIQSLSKSFDANKVINGLSFSVPEHSIFGFIGQNGAGKTTTMKMILGLLKADGGEISVCGGKVHFGQTGTNRHIGYLSDVPEFYGYMRPREYLRLCGDITGLTKEKIKSRSDELLALVGLENQTKKIGSFSRGMKQRMGIAQALLNEPKLLICDEPTSALDPIGRKEILDILQKIRGKTTVIFSTHILSDVERICDRVAVLHQGKLALVGTLAELKSRHKADSILIEFAAEDDKNRFAALSDIASALVSSEHSHMSIVFHTPDIAKTQLLLLESLAASKILPVKIEIAEPTIESLFIEVTG